MSSFEDWQQRLEAFKNDPLSGPLSRADSVQDVLSSHSRNSSSRFRRDEEEALSDDEDRDLALPTRGMWASLSFEKFMRRGPPRVPPVEARTRPIRRVPVLPVEARTRPIGRTTVLEPQENQGVAHVELSQIQLGTGSSSVDLHKSDDVPAPSLGDLAGPWASSTASLQEPEGRFTPGSQSVRFEGPVMALALSLPGRVWAMLGSRSPPPAVVEGESRSFTISGVHFEYKRNPDEHEARFSRIFLGAKAPRKSTVLVKGSLSEGAYETAKTLLTGADSIAGRAVLREALLFERLMKALDEIGNSYPGWFFERTGNNGLKAGCVYSFPQGSTDNAGILTIEDCVVRTENLVISGNRQWDQDAGSAVSGHWGIWLEGLSAGGYAMSIAVVLLFTWASMEDMTDPSLPSELDVIAEAASSFGHARDLSGQPGGEMLTAMGLLSAANAGTVTVHTGSLGLRSSYSGRVKGRDLRRFCAEAAWRTCIKKAEAVGDVLFIDMKKWKKTNPNLVPVLMVGEHRVAEILGSLQGTDVASGVTLVKTSAGWKNALRSGEGKNLLDRDWGQVDLLIGLPELTSFSALFALLLLTALGLDVPVALLEASLVLSAVYRPVCLHSFHLDCLCGWQAPDVLVYSFLVLWTIAVVTDGLLRTTMASMACVLLASMQIWRCLLCYGPNALRLRAWRVAGRWGFKRAGVRCGDIGVKHVSDFVYVHMDRGREFPAHTTSRPGVLTFGHLAVCGAAPELRPCPDI